jgi:antitoxin (DNA-binding transcriptional repressor) of toxin-antitoxin stability system
MYIMARWTIADARKRFAKVLSAAAREPQAIYKRDRLVAAVVPPEQAHSAPTLADSFAALRQIIEEEDHELVLPPRKDRANPFARTRR